MNDAQVNHTSTGSQTRRPASWLVRPSCYELLHSAFSSAAPTACVTRVPVFPGSVTNECLDRQCSTQTLGQAVFCTNTRLDRQCSKQTLGRAVFYTNVWTGSVLYKRLDGQCFIQTLGQAVFYTNVWTGSVLYKRLDRQCSIQTLGQAAFYTNAWTRRAS